MGGGYECVQRTNIPFDCYDQFKGEEIMADDDQSVLEEAKEAAFSLDKAYRLAVREADQNKMTKLKPKIDKTFDEYSQARLKLLEQGFWQPMKI